MTKHFEATLPGTDSTLTEPLRDLQGALDVIEDFRRTDRYATCDRPVRPRGCASRA